MNLSRRMLSALVAAACVTALAACGGGGGGGGGSATLMGHILLASSDTPLMGATVSAGGASFTTLADGAFTLNNVSTTATQLSVTATGVKPLTQPLPALTNGQTLDLNNVFVISSTDATNGYSANVSGVVVRGDTNAAVGGALVVLSGQGVTTGTDGKFSFTGVPSGIGGTLSDGVTPIIIGIVKAAGFLDKPIATDFPLAVGNNNPLTIVLAPPVSNNIPGLPTDIQGTIRLTNLTDFSGTTVTLISKATGATVGTVTTAANGAYVFWVVGGQYTVKAVHTGFTTQSKDVTLPSPDQSVTADMTLLTP